MSEYQNFDHAAWMQLQIDIKRNKKKKGWEQLPEKLNDFQKRVCNIIGIVGGGIYNAPISIDTIDWVYGSGMAVNWKRELSSFDFDQLTVLLFLCHEARIRVSLDATGPNQIKMSFFQRKDNGAVGVRHPNLDEAVADFRSWFKPFHQINYRAEISDSEVVDKQPEQQNEEDDILGLRSA